MPSYDMYRATNDGWDFFVSQSDGTTPQDITGWNIWFEAKLSKDDADSTVFQKKVGSGITIQDQTQPATQGWCTVALTRADTDITALGYGVNVLVYQWKIKDASGNTLKILEEGTLKVIGNVTRATT